MIKIMTKYAAIEMSVENEAEFVKRVMELAEGSKKVTALVPDPEDDLPFPEVFGYSGFLHIQCEHCGQQKSFCSRKKLTKYHCKACGKDTELGALRDLHVNCGFCGKHYKYKTNLREVWASKDCMNCGTSVNLRLNARKDVYVTRSGGVPLVMVVE